MRFMTLDKTNGDAVANMDGSTASADLLARGGRTRQRRLRSSREKRELVELTSQPGVSVSDVADALGVARSQLYAWRRQMAADELGAEPARPCIARVELDALPASGLPIADEAALATAGRIIIASPSGAGSPRLRGPSISPPDRPAAGALMLPHL